MEMKFNFTFVCLILFVTIKTCIGIKVSKTFKQENSFGTLLIEDFGMAVGGIVEMDYNIKPTNNDLPYNSYVLFLLINYEQKKAWYNSLDTSISTNTDINSLCSLPSMYRREIFNKDKISIEINYELSRNRYSVVLLQCRNSNNENIIEIVTTTTMKNIRPSSNNYSHLAIDEVMYTRVLEGEIILYALFILGILGQLYFSK